MIQLFLFYFLHIPKKMKAEPLATSDFGVYEYRGRSTGKNAYEKQPSEQLLVGITLTYLL